MAVERWFMTDVPSWERLADALKRVTENGMAKSDAQAALCRAIMERAVRVRVFIGNLEGADFFLYEGIGNTGLKIPPNLAAEGVDWVQSRPLNPWREPREGVGAIFEDWHRDQIDVFSADVTRVLCGGPPARKWRAERIRRFTENQRRTRDWINFAEIADWCSREDQSIVPSQEKIAAAYDTLASDLLAGEFEENGRSRVLYLHPVTTKIRMTREWLRDAINYNYDGAHGRSEYLTYCWIPRSVFELWLAKHRLPDSPPRFRPQKSPAPSAATPQDETAAIVQAAGRGPVPYVQLSDVLAKCVENGHSKRTAQRKICRSITDRKIRFRWRAFSDDEVLSTLPPETATRYREGLQSGNDPAWRGLLEQLYPRQLMGQMLDISAQIAPSDFDWQESCFKKPWNFGSIIAPKLRRVWIDLCLADVTNVLASGQQTRSDEARLYRAGENRRDPQNPRMAPPSRKGPAPGTVDRFGEADRRLFPEIRRIMRKKHKSLHAAALELAEAGKVEGSGTPHSRAKRLAKGFRTQHPRTATR
jgi:hypothetical protein